MDPCHPAGLDTRPLSADDWLRASLADRITRGWRHTPGPAVLPAGLRASGPGPGGTLAPSSQRLHVDALAPGEAEQA